MQVFHPENVRAYARTAARLDELEQMPVGPGLHAALMAVSGEPMDSAAAIRATVLWGRLVAHCEARAMVATAEAVGAADLAASFSGIEATVIVGEEIAALTHTSSAAATDKVGLTGQVERDLGLAWEALDRGEISLSHVRALARAMNGTSPRVATAVDARVVPQATSRGWTPSQLGRAAGKALLALDPDGAADRAAAAKAAGDVVFYAGANETATLSATGDAVPLRQVMDAIDAHASTLGADGDVRSVGERRLTALHSLVFGIGDHADDGRARPTVQTLTTIDLTTLLRLDDRPGELAGYGPISADTARLLAVDGTLRRLVTDPMTGEALDLGRRCYRPSKPLRRLIEARDTTCRFPGCTRPASRTDIDHIKEWDGQPHGPTDRENLHCLCRRHHQLKTRKLWHVAVAADGTETWTSTYGFAHRRAAGGYPRELLDPLGPPDETDIDPEDRDEEARHGGIDDTGEIGDIADSAPPIGAELAPYPEPPPLEEPPPLTDDEYERVSDALDRGFGEWIDRAFDTLTAAGLL
jgi:hypothetical protein